jgi:L-amino acid N-acyltransferase YncA
MLNPDRLLLIAYKGADAVGTVRLDVVDKGILEVSININPEMRGKGLGQVVLQRACEKGFSLGANRLLAKVKQENAASIKIFEKVGFKLLNTTNGLQQYQLERNE